MNIFKFALDLEKDSENVYKELLKKTRHTGIVNILQMLAADEVKHYNIIIKAMENVHSIDFTDSSVFEDSRILINEIIGKNEITEISKDQLELYEKAKDIELKSKKFYLEKLNESELQIHKNLFQWLAAEENKHFNVLENIITHISRPKTWVENAEFSTTEEY
jgi:rubrerythrin